MWGRLLVLAGSLVLLGVVLEAAVRAADLFPESRRAVDPAFSVEGEPEPGETPKVLGHPFLGFRGNPAFEKDQIDAVFFPRIFPGRFTEHYLRNRLPNAHGFPSEYPDYLSLGEGFHVGLFGGSVAEQMATIGGEHLVEALKVRRPEQRGPIRILNFAIGGYKQPQPLIELILARLQGIRLDVVVNLDGFNEVALSGADLAFGYDPLFPSRAHYLPVLELERPLEASATLIEGLARVIRERRAAERWRARCRDSALCASALVRAVAGRLALWHAGRAATLDSELRLGESDAPDPSTRWRSCIEDGEAACWERIVDTWQESSLMMAAVSREMGAQYLHFLQPNQYVPGSRELTANERHLAFRPENDRSANAIRGYPQLQRRIPELARRGVPVHDLTGIFADVEGDIYVDICCHFNLRGQALVARAIAEQIR